MSEDTRIFACDSAGGNFQRQRKEISQFIYWLSTQSELEPFNTV